DYYCMIWHNNANWVF
nr:immunoglobulin light chain junction region [Macaca mulatta]MOW03286.1 immunoglobulin light chain junction region [Macaca mulatta]MOX69445.1 immunoglobulin light chain junction region [Macaca mulatta]MOX69568.1 immunoglobulin light chain junction region [Macaca mulatta]MOX69801.1 immunoglobulin light chain junction region [Macaca mulatta]